MSNEDIVLKAVKEHSEAICAFKADINARVKDLEQRSIHGEEAAFVRNYGGGKDPLGKLSQDEGVKAMANGQSRTATVKVEGGLSLLTKNTIVGDTAGTSEDGYAVQPMRDSRMANDPRRRLSLLDFLPSQRVTSNSFEFNRLVGYSNAAGYQANEGALKPEGSVPTDLIQVSIATIAHWVAASEQVLADAPALRQQVDSLLRYGVRAKLESELIVGDGNTGHIAGLTDSGNFTAYSGAASGDTLADAVAKAEATMIAAGWTPGLVVVHPNTWRDARGEREADGGAYLAGSWRDPAPPNVWGIPLITNPAVTEGNMLILDPSQVMVLNRQDVTVDLGRINDQFVRNVVSIRAELRAALAVFSPGAVMFGDIEA